MNVLLLYTWFFSIFRPTLRPRLLSQSDISSDSDSGQGGKPLIEKEEKVKSESWIASIQWSSNINFILLYNVKGHRLVAMPRKGRSAKARGAGKKVIFRRQQRFESIFSFFCRRSRKWDRQPTWPTMSDLYLNKCAITLCHIIISTANLCQK